MHHLSLYPLLITISFHPLLPKLNLIARTSDIDGNFLLRLFPFPTFFGPPTPLSNIISICHDNFFLFNQKRLIALKIRPLQRYYVYLSSRFVHFSSSIITIIAFFSLIDALLPSTITVTFTSMCDL